MAEVDKRVGGTKRAEKARNFIGDEVIKDITHPLHYAKDIEFARMFDVSRHTIYKIRRDLKIPDRLDRIKGRLNDLDTSKYTMKELCTMLNVKYAGLYKIISENKFAIKYDLKPKINPRSRTQKL